MEAAQPRAVLYTRTGPPEVLTLVEKALQEPGPGQVRVRIHRSGVNPTDWKSRRGAAESAPVDPAQVPGQDGAGVIDAVGPGVDVARVGERVWIWEAAYQRPEGTTQDFALIPDVKAVELPPEVSFDLGAGLGIPFLTAHRCLTVTEGGPVRLGPGALSGRHVLVAGGAGAVGNAAIQLARWADATVITTVSSAGKAQFAAAAGADHIINYRETDVAAEVRKIVPGGVDTIVEVSAATNGALDSEILAVGGSIAMYADDGGAQVSIPIRASMGPNARWQFVLVYTAPHEAKEHALHSVNAALADGAIKICIPLHHFSLADSAKAHEAVQNSAVGKVLIDLTD
ncbi:NADPH:quinone reductase [Nakamurella sp. PAMC28650]|jgi:NADPH2:quinone reductase|uniref:NADPH:quinone reductase n=1 Tax=Nakamurella sp. PAMC28650 TaxID=2762325 RepID=UPI00164DB94B|nr:NADPH:quinone reductase [Nakamurella sp. PAMC28650]QNK82013.1 NADPH:quinone reductase [Nakamurella sp. PAMC28650]